MCPVLDTEAVERQKEELEKSTYRLKRLEKQSEANQAKIEEGTEAMKNLKKEMQDKMFDVKQILQREDIELEQAMLTTENRTGPAGPAGPPGYDGTDGVPGVDGTDGVRGQEGKPGVPGPMGIRGSQGPRGPPGDLGIQGGAGKVGKMGIKGPDGAKGPSGADSHTVECERVGGQMYEGVCLKSTMPTMDKDLVPDGCKPYTPIAEWGEKQMFAVSKMFASRTLTGSVDHGSDGGNCKNFKALMSFTQGPVPSKVWVNGGAFTYNPTGSGSSCTSAFPPHLCPC